MGDDEELDHMRFRQWQHAQIDKADERQRARQADAAARVEWFSDLRDGLDRVAQRYEDLLAERNRLRSTLRWIRFLVGPLDDDALVLWIAERVAEGEGREAVKKPGETGGTGGGA